MSQFPFISSDLERMFSIINTNKNNLRNCLDVDTIADLLKINSSHRK